MLFFPLWPSGGKPFIVSNMCYYRVKDDIFSSIINRNLRFHANDAMLYYHGRPQMNFLAKRAGRVSGRVDPFTRSVRWKPLPPPRGTSAFLIHQCPSLKHRVLVSLPCSIGGLLHILVQEYFLISLWKQWGITFFYIIWWRSDKCISVSLCLQLNKYNQQSCMMRIHI